MKPEQFPVEGRCPYCGDTFHKAHHHPICDVIHCESCDRYFVVKTQITYTLTTHRVEGEATAPHASRFYGAV